MFDRIWKVLFRIWRKRRFNDFLLSIEPRPTDTLLDVGGYPAFWVAQVERFKAIDIVNISAIPWCSSGPNDRIRTVVADGCALPMADDAYDIAYSNSTIEHVGSWERQVKFAAQLRRVAKRIWVQTPAFECPIEPHYLAIGMHYLPRRLQKKLIRRCTVWGWLERPSGGDVERAVDQTRLLRKSEMCELFPDCEIRTERILGLIPKSHVAVRRG